MINTMNHHYSFNNPASIYDEEALTALELAGRTAAKTNECVEGFNKLESDTNKHLNEQDKELSTRLSSQDNRLTTMEKTQIPNTITSEVNKQIQNGTFDTQIEEYTGGLNSRIDNLAANIKPGSTSGDAEIIDMRVAANNETFASAGAAARRYQEVIDADNMRMKPQDVSLVSGKAVIDDGSEVNAENTRAYGYVPVVGGTTVLFENINLNVRRALCCYDAAGKYISTLATNSTETTVKVNIPYEAAYVRFSGFMDKEVRFQYVKTAADYYPSTFSSGLTSKVKTSFGEWKIRDLAKGRGLALRYNTGSSPYFDNHTGNIWLKECEDVELLEFTVRTDKWEGEGQPIRFFVQKPGCDNFFFVVYNLKFTDDGSTTKGGTTYWYDKTYRQLEYTNVVTFDNAKVKEAMSIKKINVQVRIAHGYVCIYCENVFMDKYKLPIDGPVIAGYNYRSQNTPITLEDMRIVNRVSKSPYMHVSVDDVSLCLADLQTNKATYTSIFDNPFLAKLREWRLKYGAVFTLNIYSKESVNVASMTTQYKEEFQKNSDWLKFAVHSELSNEKYETFTDDAMVTSYSNVRQAIYNIAGYDCIDNMPRLGFFSANKSALTKLKSAGVGFLGCLAADDTRDSNCGLNADERGVVNAMDSYMDMTNNLHFIKTSVRMDGMTEAAAEESFNNEYLDRHNNGIFEIFFHETGDLESKPIKATEKVLSLAAARNIRFDYAQNNIIVR